MAAKTAFSDEILHALVARYDVGAYRSFTLFTHGSVQTNLLLHTTTQRYVLRYYRQNRTVDSVLFEVEVLRCLKRRNYPCAAPLPTKDGTYVGVHNAKPYVLFAFVEGDHLEHPNEQQQQQLIQKAAELHMLTAGFRPQHTDARWNYNVALCHALAEHAASSSGTANARAKLQWHTDQLAQLRLPASLLQGIAHADFHFSNVLFKGDTFAALLDFDDANYTFLVFDLVSLIEAWAWPYPSTVLDLAEAQRIVAAYTAHRPLTSTEQHHLFDVYKLSILIDCVWYFARGDMPDFYEKHKIDHLDALGRTAFQEALVGVDR